jgi:hypothetical protein
MTFFNYQIANLNIHDPKGKSKAIVAIAKKLLETMWILATRKEFYFDYDPVRYNRTMVRYNIHLMGGVGAA